MSPKIQKQCHFAWNKYVNICGERVSRRCWNIKI